MLSLIFRLYARYSDRHRVVRSRPRALRAGDGRLVGYLDRFELKGNRVEITGWTVAGQVTAVLDGAEVSVRPDILRSDVLARFGDSRAAGFFLQLPRPEAARARVALTLEEAGGKTHRADQPLPSALARARAEAVLAARFLRDAVPVLPMGLRALSTGDPGLRGAVRDALGLGMLHEALPLSQALLDVGGPPSPAAGLGVTIVLPVYNAFELLTEAIDRVERNTDLPWRLIAVEDASPDPRVRPWLRDRVAALRAVGVEVTLLENTENLGFIRSVNRAFEVARSWPEDPVVLLNSDAFVPAGWAGRLVAPILADPEVATVTPMSNDAEIFGTPAICRRTVLAPGQGDAIDAAARVLPAALAPVPAPTGVGFCMAMNPKFLADLSAFDTVFGRGYGEEVDWCRRAAALGGRHLGLPGLFVEHRGGESFGSEEKLRLVQRNNGVIEQRYPGYDRAVQAFIRDDPLLTARMALALAWADSLPEATEIPVFVAHSMGGGAELYLQNLIAGLPAALVLRLGGPARYRLELTAEGAVMTGVTGDRDLALGLVHRLRRRQVVYVCAVGDADPLDVPDLLLEMARDCPLRIEMHDYLPLSPSYTLLDSDGVFRGAVVAPNPDPAHAARRRDGETADLGTWQAAWGRAVAMAEEVTVFSAASAKLVAAVWPEARIVVRPHALLHDIPRLASPPAGAPAVLGVLGNIAPQKGAAVVSALSRIARQGEMVMIGNMDPAFTLAPGTVVTGTYAHADLPVLAARHGVTAWLVPSVWPETFCYTVHEALATGLPVLAFDLGAQGAAVRAAPNGVPLALPREAVAPEMLAERVLSAARALSAAVVPDGSAATG